MMPSSTAAPEGSGPHASGADPQPMTSSEGTGAIYICFKQFTKRLPDELSFSPGDKIEVLADDSEYNDGWYMGKNILTNEVGLYPKSFTKLYLVPSAQSGSLLRSRSRRISTINTNNGNNTSALDASSFSEMTHPNTSAISFQSHNISDGLAGLRIGTENGNSEANGKSNLAQSERKFSTATNETATTATKTMNDIDKALEELKNDALSSSHSSTRSSSPLKQLAPASSLSNATSYASGSNGNSNIQNFIANSSAAMAASSGANKDANGKSNSFKTPPTTSGSEMALTSKTSEKPGHTRGLSLNEDFDVSKIKSWTPQQVSSYFALILGFDLDILGKFARHKITGAILLELDLTLLKELDIDSFGTRYEIYKEIDKLKSMSTSTPKSLGPPSSSTFAKISNAEDSPKYNSSTSKENKPLPPVKKRESSESKHLDKERRRSTHLTSAQMLPRPPSIGHSHSNSNSNNTSSSETVDKKDEWKYYHETYTKSGTSTPAMAPSAKVGTGKHSAKSSIHHRQKLKDLKEHGRNASQSSDFTHLSHRKSTDLSFLSPRRPPEPPASEMQGYKFGGDRNISTSSTTGLGITRPASSVYDSSSPHTRNASKASTDFKSFHSPSTPHKRHSSIFLFFTTNDNEDKDRDLKVKDKEKERDLPRTKTRERPVSMHIEASPSTVKEHKTPTRLTPTHLTPTHARKSSRSQSTTDLSSPALTSPLKLKKLSFGTPKNRSTVELYPNKNPGSQNSDSTEIVDIDHVALSPKKQKSLSVSYKSTSDLGESEDRRTASDSTALSRLKTLRTASAQNFRTLTGLKKLKTSAFTEGIREISPDEAIKSSTYLGWVSKKSSNGLSWKSRYFTLHGTRLSYFSSLKDKKEKGLIDITAHKVVPILTETDTANSNDRYVALYASSTGAGRYCFKVVPPAPGFKKGLTFTQPKTHYFAVETVQDMRGWLKALMAATIDIDDTVPIVSSCSTPTVSLSKAQELLAKAREESRIKDEELRLNGFIRDVVGAAGDNNESLDINLDIKQLIQAESTVLDESSFHPSPNVESFNTLTHSLASQHKLSLNTNVGSIGSSNLNRTPITPQVATQLPGFSSPYLLASGLLSPRTGSSSSPKSPITDGENVYLSKAMDYFNNSNGGLAGSEHDIPSTATSSNRTTMHTMNSTKKDNETVTTPKSIFSNSNGRVVSGSSKMKERLSSFGK